jgi:uncharacterized membrane protein
MLRRVSCRETAEPSEKGAFMAELVVLGFENEADADGFIGKLQQMSKEQIIGLQDVVKVVRTPDGKTKIHQGSSLAATGALSGAFWGMLIGLIFWMPWLGAALGAAGGAIGGKMSDVGIDDHFIKETAQQIQPGQAGVFMLIGTSTPDRVVAEIAGTKATVMKTNLSADAEAHLRELFPAE